MMQILLQRLISKVCSVPTLLRGNPYLSLRCYRMRSHAGAWERGINYPLTPTLVALAHPWASQHRVIHDQIPEGEGAMVKILMQ